MEAFMEVSLMKTARTVRGLRQADLARVLNLDPGTISKLETRSLRPTPANVRAAEKVSSFLGLAVKEFFQD
jgi:transcriptional regulator with XRE-family HTH domain